MSKYSICVTMGVMVMVAFSSHSADAETSKTLATATTESMSLLALPPIPKEPSVAGNRESDLSPENLDLVETTVTAPAIERPIVYWGSVGHKNGYSLDSIMRMAWKANPNWNTYSANHAAAHAALVEACAIPNPKVEMEFGSETADDGGGSHGIWSLGFSQPIELPGKRKARQTEALAGFPVVRGQAAEYANALKADVRQAYWTVQYYAALEQMYAAQVSLTQKQLDLAQRRQGLGDAGKIEVVNARVELLKSQREREVSRRRKQGAKAALNALTGQTLKSDFRLAENFPHSYARPDLRSAIRAALSVHPRLATLAAQLEQKYAGIQRQRKAWWPDLNIGAVKTREFDSDSAAITAAIEIPLWNRNQGGIARAAADAQKIYAEIGVAYNELRRDVESSYQEMMIAREQIESYDNGLKDAAEELVNLAWEQLNLGGGGYVDILLARRQLIEVQQGYIRALYDAATANAKFNQAVGH